MLCILLSSIITTAAVYFAADSATGLTLAYFFIASAIFLILFNRSRPLTIKVLLLIIIFYNPRVVFKEFSIFFHFIFISNLFIFKFLNKEYDKTFISNSYPILVFILPFVLMFHFTSIDSQNLKVVTSLFFMFISFSAFYNDIKESDFLFFGYSLIAGAIIEFIAYQFGLWEVFKQITFSRAWIDFYKFGIKLPIYLAFQNPNLFAAICALTLCILLQYKKKTHYLLKTALFMLLFSTLSKGNILAFALMIIFSIFTYLSQKKALLFTVFSILIYLSILAAPYLITIPQNNDLSIALYQDFIIKWNKVFKNHIEQSVRGITVSIISGNNRSIISNYAILFQCSDKMSVIDQHVKKHISDTLKNDCKFISNLYSNSIKNYSTLGRFFLVEKAVKKLIKNPGFGLGSGNFRDSAAPFCTNESDCFISPLFWGVETGIIGVLFYFFGQYFLLKKSEKNRWFLPVLFIFIYALIENIFFNIMFNWYIGLLLSFILLKQNRDPGSNS